MLIDPYSRGWLDALDARAQETRLLVLVDGAFVPGLHRILASARKVILFASLPGASEQTMDASPFLATFEPGDKALRALLRRCDRWPMLSVIDTPESLDRLGRRLSAWCIVETDGQRFNFRFPDTRRLPGIFDTLSPAQRDQFAGPAVRWTYVARDGNWRELPVAGTDAGIATDPVLDVRQFARLVDDSWIDELMALLSDRGHDVFDRPSRSHALLTIALRVAKAAALGENDVIGWCEWFWQNDLVCEDAAVMNMLRKWRKQQSEDAHG